MSDHTAEKDARLQRIYAEVGDRLPGLMHERSRLLSAGIQPTGVVMPARLNVRYEGDDATDVEASCMGLPVTWDSGERWGLIVHLPSPIPPGEGDEGVSA